MSYIHIVIVLMHCYNVSSVWFCPPPPPSFSGLLWLVKVALMGLLLPGQDKWRNLHVMASGWGSRHRGKNVSKSVQPTPKHDDSTLGSSVGENDIEIPDAKPLASSGDVLKDVGSKKPLSRLLSY